MKQQAEGIEMRHKILSSDVRLGPVHIEVGKPGRWDSPLGGTNFFARSHGKICPGRWDVFCHVIT